MIFEPPIVAKIEDKKEPQKLQENDDVNHILKFYSESVKSPKNKIGAKNNILKHLKKHSLDFLISCIKNYMEEMPTNLLYRKECSNFFGVKGESKDFFLNFKEEQKEIDEVVRVWA